MKKQFDRFKKCILKAVGLTVTVIIITGYGQQVYAVDYNDGLVAYGKGDYEKALQVFTVFAEQGHAAAQYNSGVMYNDGEGVVQNYSEAVRWYKLAAEQGHVDAQYNLASMYIIGEGVDKNYAVAAKWHRLAAEQGDEDAQYSLGLMYSTGLGVVKNYTYAHMWWNIAAARGHSEAKNYRDEVEELMAPNDISKAQNLARECVNNDYKGC